ncbi:conserved hypothetical protein, putative phage associated protein [Novosphingobium aromaticivorans DSM 12444]|uniref:Uncharacterized protein n=1 Tax=Novosphingobium aromaticivorans (strain ATCC 700278 / DSM 12444 / CCUG 56034 / CIP 105152 / NBRC 16084 / F199) TaxID=279238 RepID=Q2G3W6_NOVAD|nr:hypothetical protein [Novosphingobium aromaticivorans]ABD27457.1 conserved hypothetical protein, putative phage associated protein [Novosphingobium aromaticivorans DSM 12444]SCY69818.1 hypothetical protein SAMN05660666_02535 [Novosphingobium aromaticivorans]
MAIMATDTGGGGDFSPVPPGTHFAVCDQVVDLGKQKSEFQGEVKVQHKVYIRWQIPAERVEWEHDGKKHEGPAVIGKTYTLSLSDKANLRKDLQAWRSKPFTPDELRGFDIAKLLGAPATITITHTEKDGKTYANVASLGSIPKGMPKPEAEGELLIYDADNMGTFDKLSKRMQERIRAQIVDTGKTEAGDPDAWRSGGEDLDDDIPF